MEKDDVQNQQGRRQLKNFLLQPKQQIRFGLYFLSGGLFVLTGILGFVLYTVTNILTSLSMATDLGAATQETLRSAMTSVWVVFTLTFLLFGGLALLMGIVITHRIYGPMVPLRRHVEALKLGDFSSRVQLRKADDFQEIAEELNQLAAILDEKLGSEKVAGRNSIKTP